MDEQQKIILEESLERIIKRSNALLKNLDDLDNVILEKVEESLVLLDECIESVLKQQKNSGKEFLSDVDVDNLIDNIYSEEGIKKFEDFKRK